MRARQHSPKAKSLHKRAQRGDVVVAADRAELERARRRGKWTIDAREVAERLIEALPELFGADAEALR